MSAILEKHEVVDTTIESSWLRRMILEAGAADAGFVELGRPALDDQRAEILRLFPRARSLVSYVCRMNREPIRSPARSVANLEFHHAGDQVNEVGRRIVAALEARGIPALNPSMGFPMEMERFPGKTWVVSHKPVAAAAGLGRMGIHRNVIHPRFGNFILLGTVLVGAEIDRYDQPLAYNPCLTCKLCVAACPTGAIHSDGAFDFGACYTHNYREFMGGFSDWVEQVVESRDAAGYRRRVSLPETASVWQSLSFGPNYKAAYCMAVCPAGEEVSAPFREERKGFLEQVVRPLQDKEETVYVLKGSDAEEHVARRFPRKKAKQVGNGLTAQSIAQFLGGLPLLFQRGRAQGVAAVWHFRFTGSEPAEATVSVRDGALRVQRGLHGRADLRVSADSRAWLRFLAGDSGLAWLLLRGRVRLKGDPRRLRDFARCFPRG